MSAQDSPLAGADVVDELARAYLDHCHLVQREPDNTLRARVRVLRTLPNAGTATLSDLEAWWAERADRSPATRVADLALLRSFYRWAAVYGHRDDDPTIRLRAPRRARRLPKPARAADVSRLLADDTLPPELRRAVVLAAFLGLRLAEVAAADWADVDLERGTLRVTGKGNKTRLVPLSGKTADLLGPALDQGNIVRPGEPYDPRPLGRRLNRAMAARGVRATCHQLRHYFGTAYYQATADLLLTKDVMGHESTQTTAGYAAPSTDAARRAADAIADALTRPARGGQPILEQLD